MLNFSTTAQYFISSLLGLIVLCAMVKLGYEKMAPAWTEQVNSEQAFSAEEWPESEALTARAYALGGAAVSQDSGMFYFLKPRPLALRSLYSSLLRVKAHKQSNTICQNFPFFRILPNAP